MSEPASTGFDAGCDAPVEPAQTFHPLVPPFY